MKQRRRLAFALFAIAALATAAPSRAQSSLELTQTPTRTSGLDHRTHIAFAARAVTPELVAIDATLGAKEIHAEVDYAGGRLAVRSVWTSNGRAAALSPQDIAAFQQLLTSGPPIDAATRHGEALASFINLMANAPSAVIDIRPSEAQTYASICGDIGKREYATYRLWRVVRQMVTVGPVCFRKPALGRCGVGAGPDPFIGHVQRFTQQCLDHDQCCNATGNRYVGGANLCGKAGTTECIPEFYAAAPGFFLAPDCATTAGRWLDNTGATFKLSGGDSSGRPRAFSGADDTGACGIWRVSGLRRGTGITFTARNPHPSAECGAWKKFAGSYSDCDVANGSWSSSLGLRGAWSWRRAIPVSARPTSVEASQSFAADPQER